MSERHLNPELNPPEDEVGQNFNIRESLDFSHSYEETISSIMDGMSYDIDTLSEEERDRRYEVLLANQEMFGKALRYSVTYKTALWHLQVLSSVREITKDDPLGILPSRFSRFALSTIASLKDTINQEMRKKFAHLEVKDGLGTFRLLIFSEEETDNRFGADALAENLDLIEKSFGEIGVPIYADYLRKILKFGSEIHVRAAVDATVRLISTSKPGVFRIPALISALFLKSKDWEVNQIKLNAGFNEGVKFLDKFGLPGSEFLLNWCSVQDNEYDKRARVVEQNLEVISGVEILSPGGSKFLHEKFGIVSFGRYPPELLLRQIEEYNDTSKPYGVILYPRSDWNGAFYGNFQAYLELLTDLKGEFFIRVAECESKIDLLKKLISFNKKYNPHDTGHKISLALIGGHGSENSIAFGGHGSVHSLYTSDLAGKSTERAGEFFEKNPTIILISCSTGTDKGIGQELSTKLGAKVIAPKIPTNIKSLHASKNRGQTNFRFNAIFADKDAKNIYMAGEKTE